MGAFMTVAAVALLALAHLAQGEGDECTYKAVGDSLTIPLWRPMDCVERSLTWTLNSTEIFRKKSKVLHGNPSVVTANGSLLLMDLQVGDSGRYKAEVDNNDGVVCSHTELNLCVIESVSKPSVTYTCSNDSVTLTCDGGGKWSIRWSVDGDVQEGFGETKTVPIRSGRNLTYSCTAWNDVSEEKSDDFTIRCPAELFVKVLSESQGVREGGDVSILCNSIPPADKYMLWTPTGRVLILDGAFELREVTREDEGHYTCQPRWGFDQPFRDANATARLLVFPDEDGPHARGGTPPLPPPGPMNTLLLLTHICLFLSRW